MRHGYTTPLLNQSSNAWSGSTQHRLWRRNSNRQFPPLKIMCIVYGDRQDVLFIEFFSKDLSTKLSMCNATKSVLCNSEQKVWNAFSWYHPYCLAAYSWHPRSYWFIWSEQFEHPLYSPGLAPSDFHLFLHLKKFLGSKHFDKNDDIQEVPT